MTATSVIVAGARTPVGRLQGALKDFSAADLGAHAIKAALERAGVAGDQVQYVILGQVLQAGAGQIPSRQAAVKAGIPMSVPSITINKVCLSGLDAIALADQLIRAGEFDIVVAGGMESMTQAPHLLPKLRAGYKYGSIEVLDHMAYDALTDAFDGDLLWRLSRGRTAAVKLFLMDNAIVVGVGNIYASEALFAAGIDPRLAAGAVSRARYVRLAHEVKRILAWAIDRGGTTLRDFISPDGLPGYFFRELNVDGRAGEACHICGTPIRQVVLGQRSTFWCPSCQR